LTVGSTGRTLEVVEAGRTRAAIDTQSLSVTVPQAARPAPDGDDGPWPLVGFAALALGLAAGAALIVRKRRRPAGAAIS
jgi:hypothetical protein